MAAIEHNLDVLRDAAAQAGAYGAHLLSFPELFLTGYNVMDAATAHELAERIQREGILEQVAAAAEENRLAIICPYPEASTVAGERRYYDSIIVYGPDRNVLKNYRKTHLWGGDERNNWSFGYVYPEEGEAYTVFAVNGVGVGVLNCYEAEFPELSRILALKGAQLLVIPTAADDFIILRSGEKTKTAYPNVDFLIRANAYQNEFFCAYSNRRGLEVLDGQVVGGYLGNSCLVDPHGNFLLPEISLPPARPDKPGSGWNDQMLMIADCVPGYYGPTHPETCIRDRSMSTHYFTDRRWSLYGQLSAKTYVNQESGKTHIYPETPE
ncbi:nitrilase [Candidatus Methylospira mobilis]|uniref:Nitrilase n=2 Tax=Candidatus Methylospira mobilis TaxID=1808979 RepID=A0A5Q0BRN4_9GAMM|nr:nitrilase [Candidatus Methylospira mobilis]